MKAFSNSYYTVKRIIWNHETKGEKYFDYFINFLVLFSIASFTLETEKNLSPAIYSFLQITELICIVIFTIEYILRVIAAENRLKFIFSFYGLIDLMAILPFYISRTVDLRSIRIFRLFRLIRIFKIFRFGNAIQRYKTAVIMIKPELIIFLLATFFMLYISSVGIYYFENEAQPEAFSSVIASMWWAVATFTTIGYGDIYPITAGGKVFTSIVVFIALAIIAVPTGLFASAITKVMSDEKELKIKK